MIPLGIETPLQATLQEAISYLYGVLPKSNASDPDDVTYCHERDYVGGKAIAVDARNFTR